jgi:hypothetical protein
MDDINYQTVTFDTNVPNEFNTSAKFIQSVDAGAIISIKRFGGMI